MLGQKRFKEIADTIPNSEFENLCRKNIYLLPELLDRGTFTNEGSIAERKKRYEKRANFMDQFIEQETEYDGDGQIPTEDFYERFAEFCKSQGLRVQGRSEVSRGLKERGYEIKNRSVNGTRKQCLLGRRWIFDLGNIDIENEADREFQLL